MRVPSIVALLVLSFAAATAARSESLGSAARRERERRQKNEDAGIKPVRTITHEDVRTVEDDAATPKGAEEKSPAAAPKGSDEPSPAAGARAEAGPPPASDGGEEAKWRQRAGAVRQRLEAARSRLSVTPRTVPGRRVGGGFNGAVVPVLNPEYDEAEREVKAAEKALQDLEEEARRAGAPPGWLR